MGFSPPNVSPPIIDPPNVSLPKQALADSLPISLADAIARTLENHPAARVAEQSVQAARALSNLPYQPGATQINYDAEGQFRPNDNRLNALGVTQSFDHPAVRRSQNARQVALTDRLRVEQQQTVQELRYETERVYLALQRQRALLTIHERAAAGYGEYLRLAETRVRLGAANPLERLNLLSPYRTQELLGAQAARRVAGLSAELGVLTGSDPTVELVPSDTLLLQTPPVEMATGDTFTVAIARQRQLESMAGIAVIEAELRPNFYVGYTAQKFYQLDVLNGFQAGVAVPLFRQATRQRLVAQEINITLAGTEVDARRQEVVQRAISLEAEVDAAHLAAETYSLLLRDLNPELARVTQLNYEEGQIGYLEILNALNLLVGNQVAQTEAVHTHNLALAQLRLLLNR